MWTTFQKTLATTDDTIYKLNTLGRTDISGSDPSSDFQATTQWASFYQRYRVCFNKVAVYFENASTEPCEIVLLWNDSPTPFTDFRDAKTQRFAKYYRLSAGNGNVQKRRVTLAVPINKILNITNQEIASNPSLYSAQLSNAAPQPGPSVQAYLHILISMNPTATNNHLFVDVRMIAYTMLYQPWPIMENFEP